MCCVSVAFVVGFSYVCTYVWEARGGATTMFSFFDKYQEEEKNLYSYSDFTTNYFFVLLGTTAKAAAQRNANIC
jgi:hypothetical protein